MTPEIERKIAKRVGCVDKVFNSVCCKRSKRSGKQKAIVFFAVTITLLNVLESVLSTAEPAIILTIGE